jgi:hypothetical protein
MRRFVPQPDSCSAANDVHGLHYFTITSYGRAPTIRGTECMERGAAGYSGMMLATRITLAHFSDSTAI